MTEIATQEPRVNEQILRFNKDLPRVKDVRLISPNGDQDIVSIQAALIAAQESGLDLVEVAPLATPPVCKLVNYGKYKYDQAKKLRHTQALQRSKGDVKTLAFGPMIQDHDLTTKINSAMNFLDSGDKVRVVIKFKGRQTAHPEFATVICNKMIEATAAKCVIEKAPSMDAKAMIMVLAPK